MQGAAASCAGELFRVGNRNRNHSAAELAARQWSVLDTQELRACGLSAGAVLRRRRGGILHPIYPGVYAWGHDGLTIRGRCLAAVKACGTDAALSIRAGLALWGLLDWEEDAIPHVTVPTSYGRKIPGIIVHRTRIPFKIVRFDSIPVTTPARALIDSSAVMPFDRLRRAVREALALRRVTIKELIATPGQRHRHLNEIIAEGYIPTRNEFEDAVLERIDQGGFTRPDVNKVIVVGGRRTKPDFRWPEQRLSIEADGGQWHDHPLAREDDAERQARLEANGERVIRVSWKQATFNPRQTIARIKAAGAPSRSDRDSRMLTLMARFFSLPAGRMAKWIVLVVVVLLYGGLASQAGKFEKAQKNETSSCLPGDTESVQALDAVKRSPAASPRPRSSSLEPGAGSTRRQGQDQGARRQPQRRTARHWCWRPRPRSFPRWRFGADHQARAARRDGRLVRGGGRRFAPGSANARPAARSS